MYEGCQADLKMGRVISMDAVFDEEVYCCKVFKYNAEEDHMQLLLENGELSDISLDAKYDCTISTKTELLACSGVVEERFHNEKGSVLVFKIENGFYNRFSEEKKIVN